MNLEKLYSVYLSKILITCAFGVRGKEETKHYGWIEIIYTKIFYQTSENRGNTLTVKKTCILLQPTVQVLLYNFDIVNGSF